MDTKDPASFGWITYVWVVLLSALGGFVSFTRKMRNGSARVWNFVELIGELCTSAFAGIITFWLCEHSSVPPLLTAAAVGIAGHAGSRALFAFERWAASKFPHPDDQRK